MVSYGTLTGERHWTWYRKTHCQVRGTGRGSVLIEIFINYFFGAEVKVSQFVIHQYATFIRFDFHYTYVYFNRIAKLSNFF